MGPPGEHHRPRSPPDRHDVHKNPGTLGFYGFRNRADYTYDRMTIANSSAVKDDRAWDILSRAGKIDRAGRAADLPQRGHGQMVTCFLTPSKQNQYTWPPESAGRDRRLWRFDYMIDVEEFRTRTSWRSWRASMR